MEVSWFCHLQNEKIVLFTCELYRVVANEGQKVNGLKTLKIRFFDNLICMYAIYTSIRFIRNTNLSNKHQYITSNKVKTKWRKKFRRKYFVDFPYLCSSPFFPFLSFNDWILYWTWWICIVITVCFYF